MLDFGLPQNCYQGTSTPRLSPISGSTELETVTLIEVTNAVTCCSHTFQVKKKIVYLPEIICYSIFI